MLVSESVCHMPRAAQSDHAKCWPNAVLVVLEVNTGAALKKVQKERGEKERERERKGCQRHLAHPHPLSG